MVTGFLTDADVAQIQTLRERAFVTKLHLANPPRTVRFLKPDGSVTAEYEALIVWANRQPTGSSSDAIQVLGQDGEVQVWGDVDAPAGSRFGIDGEPAEVTEGPIVEKGVSRVGFRLSRESR